MKREKDFKMKIYPGFLSALMLLTPPSSVLGEQDLTHLFGEACGGVVSVTPRFDYLPPYPAESLEAWRREKEKVEEEKNLKKQLPSDFDSKVYISLYPDLKKASEKHVDQKLWAMRHYIDHGRTEHRAYTFLQFYKERLPPDFNPNLYISLHLDLEKASKKAEYKEEWAILHYINHGRAEGRVYKKNARL